MKKVLVFGLEHHPFGVVKTMVLDTPKFEYAYPRPSVTVDCVVFGFDPSQTSLEVLLIQRKDEPFKGYWALPGGFVEVSDANDQGESLEEAAIRELNEETGATVSHLEQLYTYGTPERDPRGRVISVAYLALVQTKDHSVQGGSDAEKAVWFPLSELPGVKLAFDHDQILADGVNRLKSKAKYSPIGFELLPETFTLHELQQLYEHLLMKELDPSNFRRKILSLEILTYEGKKPRGDVQEVAIYSFNKDAYQSAQITGFNFEPRYIKDRP